MIKELAKQVVDRQIQKQYLAEGDRGLYQYAYEILLNQVINILISVLIAILFRAPMPVFVFLICYIPLRSFCGGHHAETNEGCTVISALLVCGVCVAVQLIPKNLNGIIQPISFMVSGLMIIRYAPVEDANKPLSDSEISRYQKRSRYIWLLESSIGMILFFIKSHVSIVIALSHIIMCVMLYWGVLKNRKHKSQIRLR